MSAAPTPMPRQLALAVALREDASFENFVADRNEALVASLRAVDTSHGESLIYVWGAAGSGKSHLLQAVCHDVKPPRQALYLPLQLKDDLAPEVFEGLERCAVVCIDDLEMIAGDRRWEEALFNGFNRMRDFGTVLVVAAAVSSHALPWALPDVASRMTWGATWHVEPLDDRRKQDALIQRARARGINMTEPVAQYIMRRYARDTGSLFGLLDRLDEATLAEKKRLTVPFVKTLLDAHADAAN